MAAAVAESSPPLRRMTYGVAFLIPADDALVEDFHVPVTLFVEDAIGQTGQVMRASSIQDD